MKYDVVFMEGDIVQRISTKSDIRFIEETDDKKYKIRKIVNTPTRFVWDVSNELYDTPKDAEHDMLNDLATFNHD